MKNLFIIFFIITLTIKVSSQTTEEGLVKWYTVEEGFKLYAESPKPIIIDVYTDWCGWCKHMMKTTFSNPNIANYINTYFYPIRFDAETTDTIIYKDKKYTNPSKKTHELAIELLDNKLSYPTIIFFDKKGTKNNLPGYLDVQDIEPVLVYFVEDVNSYANFQDFNIAYMFAFPNVYKEKIKELTPEQKLDTLGTIKWISFEEAEKLNKITPKPFFIDIYVSWVISTKVQKNAIYKNSIIAEYLNTNFYCITLDAAEKNDITLNGVTYKSLGAGQPHQLAVNLSQSRFIFPMSVYLTTNYEIINVVQGFYSAKSLEPIINYFGTEKYKTIDFQEYNKTFVGKIK